ncbi:SDR family NAD(P)-dependent oxidoreductase [Streptomyces sp. NL15-2K]|uniref:SDR family NAD(P)-dependent oxidoreductase n=1 Tax=Streptomyces sp. NL15-2K TaxID=376149 RepID=UPI00209C3C07|nr:MULTISPECIES: SDR family oxidoreductase [Actinomycetes]WKX07138.1 SDR family oxidoreductase [Kutzneria buriramensis]
MAGRLAGRIAVVTGGSVGIGQEIARKLSSEGADIAVADVDAANDTQRIVEGNGRRFFSAKVDISDEAQVNAFAPEVRDALGRVDIVVNNAGIVPFADIDDVTFEQWSRVFAVNVNGAFLTAKAFLEDLRQSQAGRVINITSGSYWVSPPPFVAYISSKGALNGFTHVLAANLAKHDVTVNAVAPGLVPTAKALQSAGEAFFDMTVQMQNLKRRQTTADVANTVAFLATDEAAFITGQILAVDGGLTRR